MTRAKKLKRAIRARAAKTGERYAAARRHVAGTAATPTAVASKKASAVGGVTDEKVIERTGKPLAQWFQLLDRFGAPEKGHTRAARYLREELGVTPWYSQGITVAYERARGLREKNQRCEGDFEASVSRVVAAPVARIADAIDGRARRARWLRPVHAGAHRAIGEALTKKPLRGDREKRAAVRFRLERSVEITVDARPGDKATVTITERGLSSSEEVAKQKAVWAATLEALKAFFRPRPAT